MLDLIDDEDLDNSEWETVSPAALRREETTRRNVVRIARAFAIAVFLLLLLNSQQLVTTVRGLPVGPVQNTVIALAETWHAQMEKNGLTAARENVRVWVAALREAGWAEAGWRAGEIQPGWQELAVPASPSLRGAIGEERG